MDNINQFPSPTADDVCLFLNRRSNTKCKTENYHTAVLHWTNQSHISDNARKPCHRVNSLIGEDRQYKINFREQP